MAEVKSEWPVGTIEELRHDKMSPAEHGACCPPEFNHNGTRKVIGCPFYDNCQFVKDGSVPKRWQHIRDKGPEMVPVRIALDSGAIVERELPCYSYMRMHEEWNEIPDSGGAVEVLDSDEYLYRGTKPNTIVENGKGITTHVDEIETRKVTKFKRPSENTKLVGDAYAAQVKRRAAEERKAKARDKRMGLGKDDE